MAGPDDVCDHDDAPIAWRGCGPAVQGRGELVVLLHGLGGSRLSWEAQLLGLGARRRAAAWDLPGYGVSAPLPVASVTFRDLADAAASWITALGAERAHVVGISMGGMIAQYLAAHHPNRVRSLTLLSTSPAFGMDGTQPDAWRAARLAPLDAGQQPADFADRVLGALAGPHITPDAFAQQRAAMSRITADALRRSIDCLITHDSRPLLPAIAAPTLVLVGDLDDETPPAYSQYLADHIPHARLAIVPGAGHLLNAEAPDAVNTLISQFLTATENP